MGWDDIAFAQACPVIDSMLLEASSCSQDQIEISAVNQQVSSILLNHTSSNSYYSSLQNLAS